MPAVAPGAGSACLTGGGNVLSIGHRRFFGGERLEASHAALLDFLKAECSGYDPVCHVDVHTGLVLKKAAGIGNPCRQAYVRFCSLQHGWCERGGRASGGGGAGGTGVGGRAAAAAAAAAGGDHAHGGCAGGAICGGVHGACPAPIKRSELEERLAERQRARERRDEGASDRRDEHRCHRGRLRRSRQWP